MKAVILAGGKGTRLRPFTEVLNLDILENLVKSEILNGEMKEKLRAMRGFRNIVVHIVVHRCGWVDDKIAFERQQDISYIHDFLYR